MLSMPGIVFYFLLDACNLPLNAINFTSYPVESVKCLHQEVGVLVYVCIVVIAVGTRYLEKTKGKF